MSSPIKRFQFNVPELGYMAGLLGGTSSALHIVSLVLPLLRSEDLIGLKFYHSLLVKLIHFRKLNPATTCTATGMGSCANFKCFSLLKVCKRVLTSNQSSVTYFPFQIEYSDGNQAVMVSSNELSNQVGSNSVLADSIES